MKGITHFAAGVAVASCFPAVVEAGAAGNPAYFILGGVFGLLPDTLDFKFGRFFYRHAVEVSPDPLQPDPQAIADAVAFAIHEAHTRGEPVRLRLNTIRLGADHWQEYRVTFDVPDKRVTVDYGPVVSTGREPVAGQERRKKISASAPLECEVRLDYEAVTVINILEGPVFEMEPAEDGVVIPRFIPWHRSWSHSLVTGILFGLAGAVVGGILAGLVMAGAHLAHVLLDQVGFMGSRLWFPFSRRRQAGFGWIHSSEALPNLAAVWTACLVIFWNLYQGASFPHLELNIIRFVFYGILLPLALYRLLRRRFRPAPSAWR